jgi:hypothetical protein
MNIEWLEISNQLRETSPHFSASRSACPRINAFGARSPVWAVFMCRRCHAKQASSSSICRAEFAPSDHIIVIGKFRLDRLFVSATELDPLPRPMLANVKFTLASLPRVQTATIIRKEGARITTCQRKKSGRR